MKVYAEIISYEQLNDMYWRAKNLQTCEPTNSIGYHDIFVMGEKICNDNVADEEIIAMDIYKSPKGFTLMFAMSSFFQGQMEYSVQVSDYKEFCRVVYDKINDAIRCVRACGTVTIRGKIKERGIA